MWKYLKMFLICTYTNSKDAMKGITLKSPQEIENRIGEKA
jgi:hypothetical protein